MLGLPFDAAAPLLPFAHQVYFWDVRRADDLGRDGHPKVGGLIPDIGLPRRMWAGGRLEFHRPLWPGREAEKGDRPWHAVVHNANGRLLISAEVG